MSLDAGCGLPEGEEVLASARPEELVFPSSPRPQGVGGPSLWGGTGSGLQMPGQAGSGVTQTQEQGQRVPSGPFKGTFDLNPGAQ